MYWFPRDCPRGTFWATPETTRGGRRAAPGRGLARARGRGRVARPDPRRARRRLPASRRDVRARPEVGGYWLSREPVEPLELVELGDLLSRHADAGIELRVVANLWPLWDRVSRIDARVQRHAPAQRAPASAGLGERPLLGHPGATREARQASGASLRRTSRPLASSSSERRRARSAARATAVGVGGLPDPEDRDAARPDEREAELGRHGRLRERLRERDAVCRPPAALPRGPRRRRRSGARPSTRSRNCAFRRWASSRVNASSGSATASGIPGEPPPEPTSTTGPPAAARRAAPREARPRAARGARRRSASRLGQPGRREHVLEPALEEGLVHQGQSAARRGTTTT